MKALVCGGRDYRDRARVWKIMDAAVERLGLTAIVQGGQVSTDLETGEKHGADWLAKEWAAERLLQCETFYADWERLGRSAGPARNQKMLDQAKPDFCIAFPGSRGTEDMCRRSAEAGLKVHRIDAAHAQRKDEANG